MSKRKNEDTTPEQPQPGDVVPVNEPDQAQPPIAIEVPSSLYAALFAVQNEIEGITKDANNPFFKSKYADRTTVLNAIRPLFAKYGLLLIQAPVEATDSGGYGETLGAETDGDQSKPVVALRLKTTIVHVATGDKLESTAVVPLPNPDPQGFASALTYTSRTSLVAILALPLLEDDDGNTATPRVSSPKSQRGSNTTTSTATRKGTETSAASDTKAEPSASTAAEPQQTTTAPSQSPSNGGKRKLWGS